MRDERQGKAVGVMRPGKAELLLLALAYLLAVLTPGGGLVRQVTAETTGIVLCTPGGLRVVPIGETPAGDDRHAPGHLCCIACPCGTLPGAAGAETVPVPAVPLAIARRPPVRCRPGGGIAEAAFFEARAPPLPAG